MTLQEIYDQLIKPLPESQRLRLLIMIAKELGGRGMGGGADDSRCSWMSVRAAAPGLLGGEDAQQWVSRGRRGSDEKRTLSWR